MNIHETSPPSSIFFFPALNGSETLRAKIGPIKFHLLFVLDLSEILCKLETLVQEINYLEVNLIP